MKTDNKDMAILLWCVMVELVVVIFALSFVAFLFIQPACEEHSVLNNGKFNISYTPEKPLMLAPWWSNPYDDCKDCRRVLGNLSAVQLDISQNGYDPNDIVYLIEDRGYC